MSKTAMKLALEALERGETELRWQAITAIKEALAESEARRKEFSETTKRNMEHVEWYLSTHAPEPVAWRYLTRYPSINVWTYCASEPETKPEREPLYTTSPQRTWVGLTHEDIEKLDCVYPLWDDGESCTIMGIKDFARAIEAKLKEKNT